MKLKQTVAQAASSTRPRPSSFAAEDTSEGRAEGAPISNQFHCVRHTAHADKEDSYEHHKAHHDHLEQRDLLAFLAARKNVHKRRKPGGWDASDSMLFWRDDARKHPRTHARTHAFVFFRISERNHAGLTHTLSAPCKSL